MGQGCLPEEEIVLIRGSSFTCIKNDKRAQRASHLGHSCEVWSKSNERFEEVV